MKHNKNMLDQLKLDVGGREKDSRKKNSDLHEHLVPKREKESSVNFMLREM